MEENSIKKNNKNIASLLLNEKKKTCLFRELFEISNYFFFYIICETNII